MEFTTRDIYILVIKQCLLQCDNSDIKFTQINCLKLSLKVITIFVTPDNKYGVYLSWCGNVFGEIYKTIFINDFAVNSINKVGLC